ncbi:MAG: DUF2961 domain-containing protein [Bacteroidales bacterium]|nr:DUF2961 domain-containing protein [Bacteroidales bacterium]
MRKLYILFIAFLFAQGAYSQVITTGTLLEEMIDMTQLAEMPEFGFKTIQYSSYDHRSEYPDYPGWYSNSDGFGREPIPGFEKVLRKPGADKLGEYLICDVKGPGAIVRLWTAWIEGEISIWIDGDKNLIYQGSAQKFFQHTYEAISGEEIREELKETFAQNTAGYYPIPFAKSLKIVWKGDISRLHFYHVQLRLYDKGTRVASFSPADISKYESTITNVASVLSNPSKMLDQALPDAPYYSVCLKPGEKVELARFEQMGAISRLAAFVTAQDQDAALKQTLLDIRFDGAPWGQIQSPIGDFFGASPGINPYESLPFSVKHDGIMVCRYLMPFEKSAFVFVENKGTQEVTVTIKLVLDDYTWDDNKSLHFRARWRADHELTANPAAVFDVPYLLYRGKGRMVGTAAFLMNPTSVPSSSGNWWGEGDEKIFIDGNLKAAFIGTGSEDYFNYAWSESTIFSHPYCGQPRNDGPANRGFVTNYRWHILDNIVFEKGFDFYMELYSHGVVEHFSYARMIYLYGQQEGHDDHLPISGEDVRLLEMPDNWWPMAKGLAANALFYQVEDLVGNHAAFDFEQSYLWSANQLAVWIPKEKEDELLLRIPVTEEGTYMIALTVAKKPGGGKFEASLDGETLILSGRDIHDLSKSFRTVSRNLKSGSIELSEGIHVLKIKSVGDEHLPIGLDYVWVKKK